MESISTGFTQVLEKINEILNIVIFDIKGSDFTLLTLIFIILSSFLLVFLSKRLSRILEKRILNRYIKDTGVTASIGTMIRYSLIVIGFITIFQSAGFDLSTLGLLAGALGVGIGFGLQNVTNNFISGIIILFERPIKVGDRIEVGDINGDVYSISMRSTTVITNDNISVIVPNSEFINSQVINWSHNDRKVRFKIPVGVAYKEDPEVVRKLVTEVARQHPGVLKFPAPDLWFEEYGDSSLNFKLIIWTSDFIQRPSALKSQLYYSIFKSFKENNIEIPFPQRDLHFKSGLEKFTTQSPENN
ncbi:mechanosensitive ion channel family protein [Marivirga sp. S37H4]|uniref:Mechanosensitive ion channel family protein n=1 Tax=Marivirga aurantiaca TaxID=2802615 RepID=A0A934WWE8_9BACT|nr:mechanosensitive ion channel domain-containing protein [Marivirga aurantiaca]MBK6264197.1 mechanosensitive ion channel family protein [Marivirga aurantiaca]